MISLKIESEAFCGTSGEFQSVSLGSYSTSWLCHISQFFLEPMGFITLATSEKVVHVATVCVVSLDERQSRCVSYLTYIVLKIPCKPLSEKDLSVTQINQYSLWYLCQSGVGEEAEKRARAINYLFLNNWKLEFTYVLWEKNSASENLLCKDLWKWATLRQTS